MCKRYAYVVTELGQWKKRHCKFTTANTCGGDVGYIGCLELCGKRNLMLVNKKTLLKKKMMIVMWYWLVSVVHR